MLPARAAASRSGGTCFQAQRLCLGNRPWEWAGVGAVGGALGLLALLQETWCGSFRERAALEGSPFLKETQPRRSSEKHSARKDPGEGRNEGTYCRRWWQVAGDPYCKFWVDGKLLLQPWEDPPVPALDRASARFPYDRLGQGWGGVARESPVSWLSRAYRTWGFRYPLSLFLQASRWRRG